MASFEKDLDRSAQKAFMARDRMQSNARSPWTRGRALYPIAGEQLNLQSPDYSYELRDESTGAFFFLEGYSVVGGPDVIA